MSRANIVSIHIQNVTQKRKKEKKKNSAVNGINYTLMIRLLNPPEAVSMLGIAVTLKADNNFQFVWLHGAKVLNRRHRTYSPLGYCISFKFIYLFST